MNRELKKHLLIVDDEMPILQLMKNIFSESPYRLSFANSGDDAKRIIMEQSCDLLLTDNNLPEYTGFELSRLLKTRNPRAKVIILTGYHSSESMLEAFENNVFAYMLKSEALENFYAIQSNVQRALDKQYIEEENTRLLEQLQEKNTCLEDALRTSRELHEDLLRSEKLAGISTVAAGFAHEIKSPLHSIIDLAHAINNGSRDTSSREFGAAIIEYAANIQSVVEDLSGYLPTAVPTEQTQVFIPEEIEASVRLLRRDIEENKIQIRMGLRPTPPVMAVSSEIQQIVLNVIKNAIEAIKESYRGESGGIIQISCGYENNKIWIEFKDNGIGIPAEKIRSIFDPFFTTKKHGESIGMGLNVTYRLVMKYHGKIDVKSTESEGTVFKVSIAEFLDG
jgi:C4-dicarboxylate-specific signal transduction histidine kinase